MYKKVKMLLCMVALAGLIFVGQLCCIWLQNQMKESVETTGKVAKPVVVIDSGHGGFDPGKVGVNGALEKDVNLQIAKRLEEKLSEEDITVVLTRETDEILGKTKKEDLQKRVELINQVKPILVVSIHQNSYHEESISGAQVFYYEDSLQGKEAAHVMQEKLREMDPENHREEKANGGYYIFKYAEAPVVIVECGFLSNAEEAERLCDPAYQELLAETIKKGALESIESVFLKK